MVHCPIQRLDLKTSTTVKPSLLQHNKARHTDKLHMHTESLGKILFMEASFFTMTSVMAFTY